MDSKFVEWVIIIATSVILAWDLYLYGDTYEGNTISQIVIKRTKENPMIPLLCGLLMGHWFF